MITFPTNCVKVNFFYSIFKQRIKLKNKDVGIIYTVV